WYSRFLFPVQVRRRAVAAARAGLPYDVINVHERSAALIATARGAAGNPVVVVTSHGLEQRAWELALEEAALGREGPPLKSRLAVTLRVQGGGIPEAEILASFPAGVRPKVRCVRTANELETAAAYAEADIFLLPSLFEGTPLTLIEAMTSGLPIVTTATCGMK